jgi:hypothetical protein
MRSFFLHLWAGPSVANDVGRTAIVGASLGSSRTPDPRNLFGAACHRDLLCLRAADGEWPDLRSQWVYSRASHAAFRIARNGDEPSEWEICDGGD